MSPRPPSSRFPLIAAALLAAAAGACAPAVAAQATYAGPSTSPASTAPFMPTTSAPADTSGPRWSELSASQRTVLAPLTHDWDGIDGRGKERWLDVASRFPRMPPAQQQRATQRMVEWSHMTVAERTQARLNFQESRSVSKEEREARWKAYQALPEEKKRELAKRAIAAAPASAASSGGTLARRHVTPVEVVQPKTNVPGAAPAQHAAGNGPAAVQARPGATTTLLTRRAAPPAHQRDGQPKIAAGPGYVDRTTLLPTRGPQAAIVGSAAASAPGHP